MDINLKSTAGRRFNASFDPLTVAALIKLFTGVGREAGIRETLSEMASDLAAEKYAADEYPSYYRDQIFTLHDKLLNSKGVYSYDNDVVVEEYILKGPPGPVDVAVDAFTAFLNEYQLLQANSGDEKTCLGAFWTLCESLQDL